MKQELIPMVDYVLAHPVQSSTEFHYDIVEYAKFLKQPLKLEMFVPCDEDGRPLEEPEDYDKFLEIEECKLDNPRKIGWSLEECNLGIPKQCIEYQKAKQRVIFEGFEYNPILKQVKRYDPYCKGHLNSMILKTIQDLCGLGLTIKTEI